MVGLEIPQRHDLGVDVVEPHPHRLVADAQVVAPARRNQNRSGRRRAV
jgi:hypothetical protein